MFNFIEEGKWQELKHKLPKPIAWVDFKIGKEVYKIPLFQGENIV